MRIKTILAFGFIMCSLAVIAQKKGKWQKLIIGNTTEGWHSWKMDKAEGWKVVDGVLMTAGKNADLVTNKEYGDFELEFEFQASFKGNSGVIYKVLEDANNPDLFATYASAPEYQVIDDKDYEGINDKQKTGANYDMYAPSNLSAVKPIGKWNKGKIIVKNNRIQHILNGVVVVDYVYGGDDWLQKLAISKFSKWAYAKPHHMGRIALQDHGDAVSYRKIKIREL